MDTNDLINKAHELQDKVQNKVGEFMNSPKVKEVNDKGAELIEKGKDMLDVAKDKLEDFVEDKTDGKGILGFGKKDDCDIGAPYNLKSQPM